MTVPEVAKILRVSKMTVYRMLHREDMDSIRVGRSFRIPAAEVSRNPATPRLNQNRAIPVTSSPGFGFSSTSTRRSTKGEAAKARNAQPRKAALREGEAAEPPSNS